MLTPRRALMMLRLLAVAGTVGLVVLLLGPYQGLELRFGMTDKPAHAIAAFFVTQALFMVAPRWRRLDLALIVLLLGALVEVAQGATGRSMSISDFAADALGVTVALVPGLIEQLRRHVRTSPDVAFADIRKADRRQSRGQRVRTSSGGRRRSAAGPVR